MQLYVFQTDLRLSFLRRPYAVFQLEGKHTKRVHILKQANEKEEGEMYEYEPDRWFGFVLLWKQLYTCEEYSQI